MTYSTSGWLYVIIGSLAIALGGYFTTKGWNQFNCHSERTALLAAAVSEWKQNQSYLDLMGKYQSMLDDLKSPMLMPTLDSDVLQSILTTHLLNPKNVKDEDLRVSVSNCVLSLKPLNDSITKINNIISSNVDFVKRKQTLGNFFGSKLMNSFKGSHLRVGNALLLLGGELSIVESATDIEPEPTR